MVYDNIVKYCEREGISIRVFEQRCGIGNGTVAAWQSKWSPSLNSLVKISKATGVPLEEWVKE